MNLKIDTKIEKSLTITETDIVGGGEILILIAYAVKDNDNLYSYPAPQIFNTEIYEKNKENYDKEIIKFRKSCEV